MRLSRGGGCTFAEDPARSCAEVTPIWSAAVDPRVLGVRCFHQDDDGRASLLGRAQRWRVVVDEGGSEHVWLDGGGEPLRIDVMAGSIRDGCVRIEPAVDLRRGLPPQIAALRRLDRLLQGMAWTAVEDKVLSRLVLALRAADAKRHGCSLRRVARDVLGQQDWPGDGDCEKSRARRIVASGEALVRGGPAEVFRRVA